MLALIGWQPCLDQAMQLNIEIFLVLVFKFSVVYNAIYKEYMTTWINRVIFHTQHLTEQKRKGTKTAVLVGKHFLYQNKTSTRYDFSTFKNISLHYSFNNNKKDTQNLWLKQNVVVSCWVMKRTKYRPMSNS